MAATRPSETWTNKSGEAFSPALHYYVGGNSKVYGAALFRLRERDFDEVRPQGRRLAGVAAEDTTPSRLITTRRKRCSTFTASAAKIRSSRRPSGPYPFVAVKHEPKIQELSDRLTGIGLHPFHLPLGIRLDQKEDGFATPTSTCMRCSYFDGFPCLLNGKADAQVMCIDPMLAAHDNVTLLTGAYVSRLGTDAERAAASRPCMSTRERRRGGLRGRHRGGGLRRAVLGAAAAALGKRAAPERPRQRLGPGRPQLHAPRHVGRDGGDEGSRTRPSSRRRSRSATSTSAATTGTIRSA